MDDIFEKKLKEFLPYIIIIGVVYLFVPAILVFTNSTGVFNQIIYIGVFPLTALLCGLHYSFVKKNDFFLSLVAPIIYIPSMLLYGNIRDSVVNSLIFLVSYFICGYIGLTIGELLKGSKGKDKEEKPARRNRVVRRVDTKNIAQENTDRYQIDEIELPKSYEEEVSYDTDVDFQDDYTEADVDAILAELHNRKY